MAKKNNKKRKSNSSNYNNNQNKNYAKKKETIDKEVKNKEEKKQEEIVEEKIEKAEVKVQVQEDIKEEKVKSEESAEKEETKDKKETSKAFNRRFWIDVVLLLLIFCVIGVLFCQIMNRSIENDSSSAQMNISEYEIKNSTLDMSIEEYVESLKENKLNTSIFGNLENKEVNEEGKDEGIFYYQGLLGEDNVVGIATKKENDKILSIDFISRNSSEEYKEDFKRIIQYTLLSSGIDSEDVDTIVSKYDNRETMDKSFDNIRVFMEYSSKDYYVTKIIYNRRLATRLKSVYSKEVSDLVGEVD